MCLKQLRNDCNAFPEYDAEGWKVYDITEDGRLFPPCIPSKREAPVQVWLNEKNYRSRFRNYENDIETDIGEKHPKGFFVFLKKEDAIAWGGFNPASNMKNNFVLCRVRFKDVVAEGFQKIKGELRPVIVARKIYIEKTVNP